MKNTVACLAFGAFGSIVTNFLGGWDDAIITLLLFMVIDYLTGIAVAIAGNSDKSSNGSLKSVAGFKGIAKKVIMLFLVAMAAKMDILLHFDYIRLGVIYALLANESLSIIENAGLMGVPIPQPIKNAVDLLKGKGGGDDEKQG